MARTLIWLGADRVIGACGATTAEHTQALLRGASAGVGTFTDPALGAGPLTAGRIDRTRLVLPDGCPPFEALLLEAIRSVLAESGVDPAASGTRLVAATTKGNIDCLRPDPEPDPRCFIAEAVQRVADRAGFTARPVVISNACISGVAALVVAQRMLEAGECSDVIVAGCDLLTEFVVAGFRSFKSVSERVCRPYDRDRDGLTLGEACGAVLLTTDPRRAKGLPVLLAGGALTMDANHLSAPSRTGAELAAAMRDAMREAGLTPHQIGFVNAHGTATRYNDEMESRALHLSGLGRTPLNSLKPYLGHTLGASGVVETILTAEQLRRGIVFGTPGFAACDTPFPVNVSPRHRELPLRAALKSASGFGGCNAALVLMRSDAAEGPAPATPPQRGVRTLAACTLTDADGSPAACIRRETGGRADLRFSRMDTLSKLGCVAADRLLGASDVVRRYGAERVGIVLANRSASLDSDIRHRRIVESRPGQGASPAVFVYTLPNIVAGEISIRHGIRGEGLFFLEPRHEREGFAARYARRLVATGRLDAVLCGWCECLGDRFEIDMNLMEKI